MLIFRSEDHIDSWCAMWNQPRGGTLTIDQAWELAQAWYGQDRRDADWRRKTADEAKSVFEEIGMTGSFWSFTG